MKPTVSIIVEAGATPEDTNESTVFATLGSLAEQDFPLDTIEIIVSEHGWSEQLRQAVLKRFPGVSIVSHPDGGYYRLKNFGVRRAGGEHPPEGSLIVVCSKCSTQPSLQQR